MKKKITIINNIFSNIKNINNIFIENKKLIRLALLNNNQLIKNNIYTYNKKNNIFNAKDFKLIKNIELYIGIINNFNKKYIYKTISKYFQEEYYIYNISKKIIFLNINNNNYIYIEIFNSLFKNKGFNKYSEINNKNLITLSNKNNPIIKINKNKIKAIKNIKKYIINSNIIKINNNILIITIKKKIIKYYKYINNN